MKKPTLTLVTLLSLGLSASACSSDSSEPTTTPTPSTDASVVVDAAPSTDAGKPDTGVDAGAPADATPPADAASTADASADASVATDAAASADASTAADAATTTDAASGADTGADATVVVDAGPPPPPGATCANAPAIAPPVSATYTMDATYGNDFTSGAGCFFKTGADRVFAVDVPATKRLYASVRGVGTFDPSVQIVEGASACGDAATTCLTSNDVGLATSLNFVAVTNTTAAAKRYFVVVDGTDGDGQYDFRALIGDPLAGETCADAQVLTLGSNGNASLTGQTVDLYANDYTTGTGCTGFAGGERVYRVQIPANAAVAVTVTPEATFDAALNVIDGAAGATPEAACASTITCSAAANVGGAGAQERVLLRNTDATPKTVFLTVDTAVSTSTPGTFDIAVESLPATPGDTCATMPRVSLTGGSASFTNESLLYAFNDYGTGTTCVGTAGPDRGYAIEIPAGKILTVVATPTGTLGDGGASTLDLALNLQTEATCTAASRTCLSGANATSAGAAERIVYANGTNSAISAVLFVETNTTTVTAPGTYDITFTLTDPPPGDTCASATTQIGPGTYPGQSLIGYQGDYGSGTGCTSAAGPDLLYLVRVPAGERLTATVTPDPLDGGTNWNPSINFMEPTAGCVSTGRVCIIGKDSASTGAPESLFWNNNSGTDKDVYVVVETSTSAAPAVGVTRGFTLDIAIAPPPPPPPGELCSNAEVIVSGTPIGDQTIIGYANDYGTGTGCSGAAGPDRFYKIVVPPGERVTAKVTPIVGDGATSWDPSINIMNLTQCQATARTCLAGSDSGFSGQPDTASWTNTTSSPVEVYIAVETFSSSDPAATATRSFTIEATVAPVAPPPPGDVCSDTLTLISASTTLSSETLSGLTSDYSFANTVDCDFFSGVDRTYRVRIPAGGSLSATITPDSTWDPTIGLVLGTATACTGTSITCASSADIGLSGDPESITYTNSSGSAVDAFIIVDSYTTSTSATYGYSLAVTITP